MRITFILTTLLLTSTVLSQTPLLVKDINPCTGSSFPASKETPVSIGTIIYFSAEDGVHCDEPWATDGTTGGTALIKDINPGLGMPSAATLCHRCEIPRL